jgi:hypothetical protein
MIFPQVPSVWQSPQNGLMKLITIGNTKSSSARPELHRKNEHCLSRFKATYRDLRGKNDDPIRLPPLRLNGRMPAIHTASTIGAWRRIPHPCN